MGSAYQAAAGGNPIQNATGGNLTLHNGAVNVQFDARNEAQQSTSVSITQSNLLESNLTGAPNQSESLVVKHTTTPANIVAGQTTQQNTTAIKNYYTGQDALLELTACNVNKKAIEIKQGTLKLRTGASVDTILETIPDTAPADGEENQLANVAAIRSLLTTGHKITNQQNEVVTDGNADEQEVNFAWVLGGSETLNFYSGDDSINVVVDNTEATPTDWGHTLAIPTLYLILQMEVYQVLKLQLLL